MPWQALCGSTSAIRPDSGSGLYLLNPRIVTAEGEWEAWFFAHWLPGANRYRSFWELMQGEYQNFVQANKV